MTRFATMFAAVALIASPALASSYSARPATAPAAKKIIGKNISWACNTGACLGSTDASRPLVLCQDLAKRTGRLESFQVDGRALNAGELDKCNASAGNSAPAAAASN